MRVQGISQPNKRRAGNEGWVYVLSNKSMPGMLKIGLTTREPDQRARELSGSTGVPTPFVVEHSRYVSDCKAVEREIHQRLDRYRVGKNREFFQMTVADATRAVDSAAMGYVLGKAQKNSGCVGGTFRFFGGLFLWPFYVLGWLWRHGAWGKAGAVVSVMMVIGLLAQPPGDDSLSVRPTDEAGLSATSFPVVLAEASPSATATATPIVVKLVDVLSATPAPTATEAVATATSSATPTDSPTATVAAVAAALVPTVEPTSVATVAPTARPTNTATIAPTNTPAPTATAKPTNTPTPRPTNTPSPTATTRSANTPAPTATTRSTNTPSPVPTATTRPTNTPLPAPTATPAARTNRDANLRAGPGTEFVVAGSARSGDALVIVGRNAAGDWYELEGGRWIAAFLVDGAPDVPVASVIPTVPPTVAVPPTATVVVVQAPAAPVATAVPFPVYQPPSAEGSTCDCSANIYNCPDFNSPWDAQACYMRCNVLGAGDVHGLDRDSDGNACEWDS